MSQIEKSELSKLHIAKFDDWTLGVAGDQHVLGWLIIFPPRHIHGSLMHLSDEELIKLKQISLIAEDLLKEAFGAEWFNYLQAGNVVKNLHVHLQPRYSTPRNFNNHIFTDSGWGHPVKYLPAEELASKEIVFGIVKHLRNILSKKDIKDFKIEITNN